MDGLWGSLVPEYSTVPVRILVSVRDNAIDTRIVLYCTRTSISTFATLQATQYSQLYACPVRLLYHYCTALVSNYLLLLTALAVGLPCA